MSNTEKKPITKQWWFWLIIVVVVVGIVIFAVTSGGSSESSNAPQSNQTITQNKNSSSEKTAKDYCEVLSAKASKDEQGRDVVTIELKYTNNTDKPNSVLKSIWWSVSQKNVDLEGTKKSSDNVLDEIAPGDSIVVTDTFILNNLEDDITVTLSDAFTYNEGEVVKTVELQK